MRIGILCQLNRRSQWNLNRRSSIARGRLWCASKFRQPDTKLCFRRCPLSRTCHLTVTKSPLGLFKEISPKRNFFQRDPRRGSLSLHAALRHANSLLLRFADASRGAAPTPRKPSRRLDPSLVLPCGARFFADITWESPNFSQIDKNNISVCIFKLQHCDLRSSGEGGPRSGGRGAPAPLVRANAQ